MSLRQSLVSSDQEPFSTAPERHQEESKTVSENDQLQLNRSLVTAQQHLGDHTSDSSHPDPTQTQPATRLENPVDGSLSTSENPKTQGFEQAVSLVEPQETHAFLSEDRPSSTASHHGVAKAKKSHSLLLTTWWAETASLTISLAAFIAIVITMIEYNEKEQPAWRYTINLSTLIAILSTLLRACTVIVTEEVMSQLKWMLFRQPKPLRHLAHFDTAARGPWGSLLLFFRTRTLDPALIGCIVIVLSVGIGPFTQQAVKTVACNLPLTSADSSIKTARWIHHLNLSRSGGPDWDLDLDTKVAILDGLANSNTTRSDITPDCSSGNCTFPSYRGVTHSSVGLCKICRDATPCIKQDIGHAQLNDNSTQTTTILVLPDGSSIGNSSGLPKHIATVSSMNTIYKWNHRSYYATYSRWNGSFLSAFNGVSTDIFTSSIFNVSVVTFTNHGCEPGSRDGSQTCSNHVFKTSYDAMNFLNVAATSCSFYPCVRDYHGSIQNTRFTETVIAETPILQPPGQGNNSFPNFIHFHTPCIIDGQAYTIANVSSVQKGKHNFTRQFVGNEEVDVPTQCLFGMYGVYALSLGDFMSEILGGDCNLPAVVNFQGRSYDYNSILCDPWALKGLVAKGNASFESIDANMQSVALAITSEIRKQGSDWDDFWSGSFDWKWLAFPLVLVILSILLLCITCSKMLLDKRRIPAWKSSILPLLFTGDKIGSTVVAGDLDQIIMDTDKIIVKLSHDGKGWEFVSAYNPSQEESK